jgi:hypothetical protein
MNTELSPTAAGRYLDAGFELGVHVDSACRNQANWRFSRTTKRQLSDFAAQMRRPSQSTNRNHCIVWNGWTDMAEIQREHGIRLDMNFYHWPPSWLSGRAGFMTGSGFPMPFVREDGRVLDIYQAATHLVNESGVPQKQGVHDMLVRALGPEQLFGAFGTHYDYSDSYDKVLIEEALKHQIAMISADQMLRWLDARNGSLFRDLVWSGSRLTFTTELKPGAEYATVLLPAVSRGLRLATVTCSSADVDFHVEVIKGLQMAMFPARAETCEARYAAAATRPSQRAEVIS